MPLLFPLCVTLLGTYPLKLPLNQLASFVGEPLIPAGPLQIVARDPEAKWVPHSCPIWIRDEGLKLCGTFGHLPKGPRMRDGIPFPKRQSPRKIPPWF
jgi:hypothetical protein